MFKTNAPDSAGNAYVDIDEGLGTPGTRLTAEDRNVIQDELVNAVESSGQVIDVAGGVKSNQIARAMTTAGLSSISGVDTGVANAYAVSPRNSGLVLPESLAALDGATVAFFSSNVNTGAATLDFGGLGAATFTAPLGVALKGGEISGWVMATYIHSTGRWLSIVDASSGYNSGDILLWAGAVSDIPGYKHICDGTNGTPDLTDRFVIHADADAAGTHNVGDTISGSGATEGHQLVEAEIPAHEHPTLQVAAGSGLASGVNFTGAAVAPTGSTGGDGEHDHDILDYKPKSYALAYVMVL